MSNEMIITILASLAAAISFAAFAYPFLKKSEKKDKYKSIIEKRRQDLFREVREGNKVVKEENVSARDSMATLYRFQKMAGSMGENARQKMMQAGIRDTKAHMRFIVLQLILPVVLVGLVFAYFQILPEEKQYSDSMKLLIFFSAAGLGYKFPDIMVKNKILKRQEEFNLSFPDSLDMMMICVQGGIGLEQTIERVAGEVSEQSAVLAEELGILCAEMAMLNDRRKALQDFAARMGTNSGKSFATALIQAEQYGTSVSNALKVMSDELRDMRMAAAEQKAASLPPKLTVPMIAFFLPVLFVIILGPAGIEVTQMRSGG